MRSARKFLAGKLIRLAHRVYPPRVTETTWDRVDMKDWPAGGVSISGGSHEVRESGDPDLRLMVEIDRYATDRAVYIAGPMGPAARAEHERREARGWS